MLTAHDGEAACHIVNTKQPHLIIMDVMMPQCNGIIATMRIRQNNNVPILMLSAKAEGSDRVLGLEAGADDYLSEALTWEFPDLWGVFIVVCLFIALYRVRIPSAIGRVLAFGASGCYGGYLLSRLFDAWCYKLIPGWRNPEHYALIFFCITVPIFVIALLLGALLDRVIKWPCANRKGASKCLH